jgi:hypothetical protein
MNENYRDVMAEICVPGYLDDSLLGFASRVAVLHKAESAKIAPDNAVLQVLEDALRVGWELAEKRVQPVRDLQQELHPIF